VVLEEKNGQEYYPCSREHTKTAILNFALEIKDICHHLSFKEGIVIKIIKNTILL